ncbi:MAG: hypothetical protein ABIP36_05805 [Acidimicrobiales bacterium]
MTNEGLEQLEHAVIGATGLTGQGEGDEVLHVEVADAHGVGVAVGEPGHLG